MTCRWVLFAAACWSSHAAGSHIIVEGELAPAFTLADLNGVQFASGALAGHPALVCFVRPQQDRSIAALRDLMLIRTAVPTPPYAIIAIVAGDFSTSVIEDLLAASGFKGTTLRDPKMRAYGQYGIVVTPSTVIIGSDGKIAFSKAGYDFEFQTALEANLKFALGLVDAQGRDRLLQENRSAATPRSRIARLCALARSLRENGQLDEAETVLRKALQEPPPALEARLELAEVLLARARPQDAMEQLRDARDIDTASGPFRLVRGRVLFALDKLDEAEADFYVAAQLDPRSGVAHYELGKLYEKRGRKDEAIAELKTAVELLLAVNRHW